MYRTTKLLIISLVLILAVPVWAFEGFDYESITVSSTAIGFTDSKLKPESSRYPGRTLCTVESNSIRFRYDGTSPTDAEGHLVASGSTITIEGWESLMKFRMIRVTNDATVKCTLER